MPDTQPVQELSAELGLTEQAVGIGKLLVETAENGLPHFMGVNALAENFPGAGAPALGEAIAELETGGFVTTLGVEEDGLPTAVFRECKLYACFDPAFAGHRPHADAAALASLVLEQESPGDVGALHEASGWALRRFNPALMLMVREIGEERVSRMRRKGHPCGNFSLADEDRARLRKLAGSFSGPESLREAVAGALRCYESAQAGGEADAGVLLAEALELLPEAPQGLESECGAGGFGPASLALALAGGPQAKVLGPSELGSEELRERLGQLALFGETRIFAPEHGVTGYGGGDGGAIVLFQEGRQARLSEDGSIQLAAPFPRACTDAFDDPSALTALEEDVCALIAGFLKFSSAVLDRIDEAERLAHVAVAARALGAGGLAWTTRKEYAEATARHGAAASVHGQGERAPVHLEPPQRTRAELRQGAEEMAKELTARLGRELKGE